MFSSTPEPGKEGAEAPPIKPSHPFRLMTLILCILPAASLGITYSFGIFMGYLDASFPWSREAISGIFSLHLGLVAISSILTRWAYIRYGPRPLLPIMALAGGAGLLSCAHSDALWQFFFSYGVLLALGTGTISGFVMSTMSHWSPDQRRPALSAAGIGIAVGILIITLIVSRLTWSYDWRDAFTVLSFILWAIALPSVILLWNIPRPPISPGATPAPTRWNPRSRNSWLLPFACLTYAFALHLVISHAVIRAEGIEMSALRSGALLTVMAAAILPSRWLAGWVNRTLGRGTGGVAFALLHAAIIFWFVDPDGTRSYFLFAISYGIAIGGMSRFVTDGLGEPHFRHPIAPLVIAWGIGSVLGPWAGGRIADRTEGYEFAFFCAGVAAMAVAVSIWGMKGKQPPVEEITGPAAATDRLEHAGDILNDAHGKEEHDAGEHESHPQHDERGPGEGQSR